MSRKLRAELEAQLEQIDRLSADVRALTARSLEGEPGTVEVAAMGAMLHAFYNGVENCLKQINVEYPQGGLAGHEWHMTLLDGAGLVTSRRGPILEPSLVEQLKQYLQFRHVFRHAYTFTLRWDKMRPLVEGFDTVQQNVVRSIRDFLSSIGADE